MKKTGILERPVKDGIIRAIMESRGDVAVASFKSDGTINFASRSFISLYGRQGDEMSGGNMFDHLPDKDRKKILALFGRKGDEGGKNDSAVFTLKKEDRTFKWTVSAMKGPGRGKEEALAVIYETAGPGKKKISGPGTYNSGMDKGGGNRQKVREPGVSGDPDGSRSDINNIKHGLRSHLNVIIGYSQYLAKSLNITESQKKQIEMIQDNGYYLLNWIDEIFQNSKRDGSLITEVHIPEIVSRAPGKITGYAGEVKRILIVDDWEAARIFLSDLLYSLGFEIAEAANGADCLLKIDTFRPHAVLLDLIMPTIGGLEIMRELQAGDKLKDMKVIMVTANDSEEVKEKSFDSGCVDFITKPIKFDDLFNKLGKHLSLTWLYGGENGPASAEVDDDAGILPPPVDLLRQLHDAAQFYDYQSLMNIMKEIEKMGDAFIPFTERIKSLADKFEMKNIIGFIRGFIG